MLKRLSESEEDTDDNWLQAYMAGEYFDKVFGSAFFLPEIRRAFLNPLSAIQTALECEWSSARPIPGREMRLMMDIPEYITEHCYNDVRVAHRRNFRLPFLILRLDRALYAYMEKRKQKTWEGVPASSRFLPSFTTAAQAKQIIRYRRTIRDV